MNTASAPLAQNIAAGTGVSPTSGDGNHPPGIPRGLKLGDGPMSLGTSGPFSGRTIGDLGDMGLWTAMNAINPNNPGQQNFAPGTPEFAAQQQKRKQHQNMSQVYNTRRDAGLRKLGEQQHPDYFTQNPPSDWPNPPNFPPLLPGQMLPPPPPPKLWQPDISNLDEYDFAVLNELPGWENTPHKVGFSENFSHPEGATAYFTNPARKDSGERDYVNLSQYEKDVRGFEPSIIDPEPSQSPSLWFTGDTSNEARLENDQIARQHYNYITTDNPWGY